MNKDQYEQLVTNSTYVVIGPVSIDPASFTEDMTDRTLLYGYDNNRVTWHVYLKDGVVHRHTYNQGGPMLIHQPQCLQDYIPNKRVYPELSNFEFCRYMKVEKGCNIIFLPWSPDIEGSRESAGFFGVTKEN